MVLWFRRTKSSYRPLLKISQMVAAVVVMTHVGIDSHALCRGVTSAQERVQDYYATPQYHTGARHPTGIATTTRPATEYTLSRTTRASCISP